MLRTILPTHLLNMCVCVFYIYIQMYNIYIYIYIGNGMNKGNNTITELRTILQRESQNS
jgi:hypothetical protein